MQETIVGLGYHRTAIYADTANFQGSPYRVTGEQLVVGRDSCELHHTEFHYQMVDQLLCLSLGKGTVLKVTLNVNIKEGRDTANAHCSTVLGFNCGQISEVQPLNSLFCGLSRLGNIVAVRLSHNLHILQSLDLHGQLFSLADDVIGHGAIATVSEIILLLLDQEIDTVQSNTTVVAYDTSTAVGIRKTGNDLVVTSLLHLRSVSIKYALIVGAAVLGEDLVKLRIRLITVVLASLLSHLDTAIRHESSL